MSTNNREEVTVAAETETISQVKGSHAKVEIVSFVEVADDKGKIIVKGPSATNKEPDNFVTREAIEEKDKYFKQYVNVINGKLIKKLRFPGDKPNPAYGNIIRFKAEVSGGQTVKQGQVPNVYFKATSGGDTVWQDRNGYGLTKGWTKVVKCPITQDAGSEIKIEASLSKDFGDKITLGTYVVWRKLWYELDSMQTVLTDDDIDEIMETPINVFNELKIELELQGENNRPDFKETLQSDNDLLKCAKKCFKGQRLPLQIHIVFVNHNIKRESKIYPVNMKSRTFVAPLRSIGTNNIYYFIGDGKPWFESASYRKNGRVVNLTAEELELVGCEDADKETLHPVDQNVWEETKHLFSKLKINLDQLAGKHTGVNPTDEDSLLVSVKYYIANIATGTAKEPHVFITAGSWKKLNPDNWKKKAQGTIIHEMGHYTGMVPGSQIKTYTHTLGGDHCTSKDCVMYESQRHDRPVRFCKECEKSLQKMSLIQK